MDVYCIIVTFVLIVYGVHATEFDVIPGGQRGEMKETLGDVTCIFSYICQGGTKEKWEMIMNKDDSSCQVMRGDGKSYLFFQEFHVEVQGAKVEDAMVFKNGPKEVETKQFAVDFKKNKVTHSDKFEAELSGLHVKFSKKKAEL